MCSKQYSGSRGVINLSDVFTGVYRPADVARYIRADLSDAITAKTTSKRLTRWIRNGYFDPDLAGKSGRDMTLSFEDLISMRVIATLRSAGVTFPKIRVAEGWLRQQTRYPRPFAVEQIWTESSDVFAEMHERLIAASRYGQLAMEMLREELIPVHGLTFNSRRIASLWSPREGILLDPEIQFGQSCISGTGIPTNAIASMNRAGDSIETIADMYAISGTEVESAISWEFSLAA
ncbi:MAG: DUF433 domain-containing protein [Chloroflexi bacterium]|nr:DUF433 domain-containing protein [Chloroflexota bacterium]